MVGLGPKTRPWNSSSSHDETPSIAPVRVDADALEALLGDPPRKVVVKRERTKAQTIEMWALRVFWLVLNLGLVIGGLEEGILHITLAIAVGVNLCILVFSRRSERQALRPFERGRLRWDSFGPSPIETGWIEVTSGPLTGACWNGVGQVKLEDGEGRLAILELDGRNARRSEIVSFEHFTTELGHSYEQFLALVHEDDALRAARTLGNSLRGGPDLLSMLAGSANQSPDLRAKALEDSLQFHDDPPNPMGKPLAYARARFVDQRPVLAARLDKLAPELLMDPEGVRAEIRDVARRILVEPGEPMPRLVAFEWFAARNELSQPTLLALLNDSAAALFGSVVDVLGKTGDAQAAAALREHLDTADLSDEDAQRLQSAISLIERRSNSNVAEGNLSMADQQDGGELSMGPPEDEQ